MNLPIPDPRRAGGRLRPWLAVLFAGAISWPGVAPAGIVQIAIDHYVASVGNAQANYFNGALLTEHDLDQEQSYLHSSNRYIGETEQDLNQLFAPAGFGDVVLLFDEGDALFENRTDVQDSHDRYADDFIVLNPQDGTWRGRLYLEELGDIQAGVYDDLSGSFQDLVLVAEPSGLAPILLALAAFAVARRRRTPAGLGT